jgi:small subunit ribosomal protein S18
MTNKPFFRRKKVCPFSSDDAPRIDYKDVKLLQRYISERGKVVPSRITAVSAKKAARTSPRYQTCSFFSAATVRC